MRVSIFAAALAGLMVAGSAEAALMASATIELKSTGGTVVSPTYTYGLKLNNTGTTTIGTLWYAWIPGENYLATRPTSLVNPAGWTSSIIGGSAGQGFSIRWLASAAANRLPAGSMLQGFEFTTIDPPSGLDGLSVFFPSKKVGTAVVYSAGAFSDSGFTFVASPVVIPEPVGVLPMMAGAMLLAGRRRR